MQIDESTDRLRRNHRPTACSSRLASISFALALALLSAACGRTGTPVEVSGHTIDPAEPSAGAADVLDVSAMDAIPDGDWVVEMAQEGQTWETRFEAEGGALECVGSGLPTMVGMRGGSELIGNGVFVVQVRNGSHAATQFWVFGEDGTAAVKEVPDRGERQRAWRAGPLRNVEG